MPRFTAVATLAMLIPIAAVPAAVGRSGDMPLEAYQGLWRLEESTCSGTRMEAMRIGANYIALHDPSEKRMSFTDPDDAGFVVNKANALLGTIVSVETKADEGQVFSVKLSDGVKLSFSFWTEQDDQATMYFINEDVGIDLIRCPGA